MLINAAFWVTEDGEEPGSGFGTTVLVEHIECYWVVPRSGSLDEAIYMFRTVSGQHYVIPRKTYEALEGWFKSNANFL